jgi:hypothetical protein
VRPPVCGASSFNVTIQRVRVPAEEHLGYHRCWGAVHVDLDPCLVYEADVGNRREGVSLALSYLPLLPMPSPPTPRDRRAGLEDQVLFLGGCEVGGERGARVLSCNRSARISPSQICATKPNRARARDLHRSRLRAHTAGSKAAGHANLTPNLAGRSQPRLGASGWMGARGSRAYSQIVWLLVPAYLPEAPFLAPTSS